MTPGIAHALRLADTYLFLALGYCADTETLLPEEDTTGVDGLFPNPH